jgi:N-acetyl-gamma-glutamyl-phosphate reductase
MVSSIIDSSGKLQVGLIGARGHVGSELIRLLAAHPVFELNFVASARARGRVLSDYEPSAGGELRYINPTVSESRGARRRCPRAGPAERQGRRLRRRGGRGRPGTVVVDLSADFRFDDAWHYGLPELTRSKAEGARRISNPGCYATAMQLALAPLCDEQSAPPQCFRRVGYSGAGTSPSDKNDPDKLRDNLMPYALLGHIHEREVTRQLGMEVEFVPAVAPHFRGITMTCNVHLSRASTLGRGARAIRRHYAGEPLVEVLDDMPWVSRIAGRTARRSAASRCRGRAAPGAGVARSTTCSRARRRRRCRTSTWRSAWTRPSASADRRRRHERPVVAETGSKVDAASSASSPATTWRWTASFFAFDIEASGAHAEGLARIGILTRTRLAALERELGAVGETGAGRASSSTSVTRMGIRRSRRA